MNCPCRNNQEIDTEVVRMPDGHRHYAKLQCALCKKYMQWLPDPAKELERQQKREHKQQFQEQIDLINKIRVDMLNTWEGEFYQNVKKFAPHKVLSEKQIENINKIIGRYERIQ